MAATPIIPRYLAKIDRLLRRLRAEGVDLTSASPVVDVRHDRWCGLHPRNNGSVCVCDAAVEIRVSGATYREN